MRHPTFGLGRIEVITPRATGSSAQVSFNSVGRKTLILEYAKLVLELIPSSSSSITYHDPVPDDPARRRPDIGRARTELNWQPRVPLHEGLRHTIEYFRQLQAQ